MKTLPSVQGLEAAFQKIIQGDRDTLQKSQEFLQEASGCVGFITRLLLILNKPSVSVSVKKIAIMHFTRRLKTQWQQKTQASEYEKEIVKNQIINTSFRCQIKLIKPYRDVISFIVKNQYRNWPIEHLLAQKLEQPKNMGYCFHYLLSISEIFEYCNHQVERYFFSRFLTSFLPVMLDIVNQYQIKELIYLSIKFICKAVHLEISAEVKTLVCDWMPLICQALGATNLKFDRLPEEVQQRHSQEFYYFHTKKWATRVFLLFVEKHAKLAVNARNNNRIFSDFWYANYSGQLITSLVNQMSIKTTNQIRCLQLKCLYILTTDRPELVEKYAEFLQYTVLSQLIRLQPEDQQLANTDPQQFIRKEQNEQERFEIVKTAAIETWAAFSELGMRNQRQQTFEPGVFFYQNISYIQSKLQRVWYATNVQTTFLNITLNTDKENPSLTFGQVHHSLVQKPLMFLRARAVDIFYCYGRVLADNQIIKAAAQGIFNCLAQDCHPVVSIKAAFALNHILSHQSASEFIRPFLQNILSVFSQLLQNYQFKHLIASLEKIIQVFPQEASLFAVDLVNIIHKAFLKILSQDVYQGQIQGHYDAVEAVAIDCINIIKLIIESLIPVKRIHEMESVVISIAQITLGENGSYYIEQCMELMNTYLQKTTIMSEGMWFYCQTMVFNIVGLQNGMTHELDHLSLTPIQKKLWEKTIHQRMLRMEDCFQFLSSCIQKISKMKHQPNFQTITTNFISLLFYLFENIYKFSAESNSQSNDTSICISLMIYLLESFQSTLHFQFYFQIWNYFEINLQLPQRRIKVVNSQLLALLIQTASKQILTLAYRQNFIHTFLRQITQYKQNYKNIKERSRVILGVSSLLQFAGESAEILEKIPQIIDLGLTLLQKNAIERSNSRRIQFQSEEENNSDDSVDMILSSSENLWDYNQDTKYNSPLTLINEQEEFAKVVQQFIHLISQEDQARICQRFRILRNY